jgi:hypothetical protein
MGVLDYLTGPTDTTQVNAPPQAEELDAQGNPKKTGFLSSWLGGRRRRRRRQSGGSFVPNDAHSSASDAAPFTGGRRCRSRRSKRGSKRRTRRHRR